MERMEKSSILVLLFTVLLIILFSMPLAHAQATEMKGVQYGSPDSFAEFHGFVNLQYADFDSQLGPSTPSTFDLRDFYLSARSKIRQNVTIFGEIEVEQGVFKLDRAVIDLQIARAINFQVGQFFTPFGIDKVESVQAPFNKLASVPLPLGELGYEDWSDVGIQMYGESKVNHIRLGYNLALMKGPAGFTETDILKTENNRNKMFFARATIGRSLIDGPNFELGASAGYGKYDDASRNIIRLWGADAKIQWSGLDIRGEYIGRGGGDATLADSCNGTNTPGTCTPARAEANGYYLQMSYLLLKNLPNVYSLEPVVRLDKSDLADHFPPADPDTASRRLTVGINYAPYAHIHLKGEYQFIKNDGTDLHNDGMMFSVVADF